LPFRDEYRLAPTMTHLLDSLLAALTTPTPATVAGAFAVTLSGIWPLLATRRRILGMQVLSSCVWGLHFLLLGAHTAAAMCVAGALQGVAATMLRSRWARDGVIGATVVVSLAITVATWSGIPSILAQSGQLASAVGRLQRGTQTIRLIFLGSEVFWVSHNVLVGSSWGLMSDAMAVSMLAVGLWRGWARRPRVPVGIAAA
jgi:hypothetical protein